MSKKFWLMKTEPHTFSFDDLQGRPSRTDRWEGVRNYQARNFMRDDFAIDDSVFIYHSSTDEPGIVGIAKIVRAAYPDPTALDPLSPYFDPKSQALGQSRWVMVDVQAMARFAKVISLKQLKGEPTLQAMALLRPGQRLSIQPVSHQEWEYILTLSVMELLGESGKQNSTSSCEI